MTLFWRFICITCGIAFIRHCLGHTVVHCLQDGTQSAWAGLVGLTALSFDCCEHDLSQLSALTNLKALSMQYAGDVVDPDDNRRIFAFLSELQQLRDLNIESYDQAHGLWCGWPLAPVLALTGLTRLGMQGWHAVWEREELEGGGVRYEARADELQGMSALKQLQHLIIGGYNRPDVPLGFLSGLRAQRLEAVCVPLDLSHMDLSGLTAITRLYACEMRSVELLTALQGLQSLHVQSVCSPKMSSSWDLEPIAALTALTRLVVCHGASTKGGSGLGPLTALTALRELFLLHWGERGSSMTWAQLAQLTSVTALGLWKSRVNDEEAWMTEGMRVLQTMRHLRALDVGDHLLPYRCRGPDLAALAALRAALPQCTVRAAGRRDAPYARIEPFQVAQYRK